MGAATERLRRTTSIAPARWVRPAARSLAAITTSVTVAAGIVVFVTGGTGEIPGIVGLLGGKLRIGENDRAAWHLIWPFAQLPALDETA